MSVLVAVDGGGSKTDVLVLDPDGTVLAHARGPGSCPQVIGVQPALDVIDGLVRSALAGRTDVARVGIYLSGLDLPVEIATFRAALQAVPWFTPDAAVVDNDTFALLRAGTASHEAVVVVCGTGINCVGRRSDGATARFPALGRISGDWGGGFELGEQAIWHAARALDGRGPATALADLVPAALGRPTMAAVIEDLHFGVLGHDDIAGLSPVVLAAAGARRPGRRLGRRAAGRRGRGPGAGRAAPARPRRRRGAGRARRGSARRPRPRADRGDPCADRARGAAGAPDVRGRAARAGGRVPGARGARVVADAIERARMTSASVAGRLRRSGRSSPNAHVVSPGARGAHRRSTRVVRGAEPARRSR